MTQQNLRPPNDRPPRRLADAPPNVQQTALAATEHLIPQLQAELAAARAELSRLRGVVEAVQALADDLDVRGADGPDDSQTDRDHRFGIRQAARALRAVLAPVSSSGEAESGEACGAVHPTLDLVLPCQTLGRHALHRSTTTYGAVVWWDAERPAPVPSGGQADGEGLRLSMPMAYRLGALADWCDSQRTSPTTADLRALAEVAAHEDALTARPVLSREALAEAWDKGRRMGASRAMRHMSDEPGLPLASELDNPYLAGGEQA